MRSTAARWPLAVGNRLTTDRRCCSFMALSYPTWGGVTRGVARGSGRDRETGPHTTSGSQSGEAAVPPLVDWEISANLRSLEKRRRSGCGAASDGDPSRSYEPPSESSNRMGMHRRGRAHGILLLLVGAGIVPPVLALIPPVSPLALVATRAAATSGVPPSPRPSPTPSQSPTPSSTPSPRP